MGGREFGMIFVRTPSSTPSLSFSGHRMVNNQDFVGCYTGNLDGRSAKLQIRFPFNSFSVVFKDFAGNTWFRDVDANRNESGISNVLGSLTLQAPLGSGRQNLSWEALYLHTWDTKFVSGVSVWNGQRFGMAFTKFSTDSNNCTI